MEEVVTRPHPDTRGVGKQYWTSGQTKKLSIPKCQACNQLHWYPRLYCPHCGSDTFEWINCNGKGVIHTFTVVRQSGHPFFKTKLPYVLAMVALEEGPLVMSNIIDCNVDAVEIGASITVVFEDLTQGVSIPLFMLAKGEK